VPLDPRARVEAELAPVFDAIDDVQRAAAIILATAETDAATCREASAQETRARAARAEREAAAARAAAAREVLAQADLDCRRAGRAARVEADRVLRVGRERVPQLVEELVRRALLLGNPDAAGPPAGAGRTEPRVSPERPAG
jgi:hypothetical protein